MAAPTSGKKVFALPAPRGLPLNAVLNTSWQKSSGALFAVHVPGFEVVTIYSRQGDVVQTINLTSPCVDVQWDSDGDILAIIMEGNGSLLLWESHSRKLQEVDTGIKDPASCISWSQTGKILAFASAKGNLLVYNHKSLRRVPIIGKHNKRIVASAWSNDNMIGLASSDNLVSVNTVDGDTVKSITLRGRPTDLKFGQIKEDRSTSNVDNTISAIVAEKTLYILKFEDGSQSSPLELGFQSRYGNLVCHYWHGDGYILVCFTGGFVVLVSSHHKEIGTELALCELKNDPLRHATLCMRNSKIAICCGDSSVQVHEASDPRTIISVVDVSEEDGRLRPAMRCSWSDDGQLLIVSSGAGDLHGFLMSVPMVGHASHQSIAALNSLTDLSLYAYNPPQILTEITYKLEMEPSIVRLSGDHVAVVGNNRVWIYTSHETQNSNSPPNMKDFNSNVHQLAINNEYIVARCGDKAHLHLIEGDGMDEKDIKTFPDPAEHHRGLKITCVELTLQVLLYGCENGVVKIFLLETWTEVNSVMCPSKSPIKAIFPDSYGVNTIVLDKQGGAFYFYVPHDSMLPINNFPSRCDGILWDCDLTGSTHIFLAYTMQSTQVHVFALCRDVLEGDILEFIGNFRLFNTAENVPLMLHNGVVICHTSSGRLIKSASLYHENLETGPESSISDGDHVKLQRLLSLKKFKEAQTLCLAVNDKEMWISLAEVAMKCMQLDIAQSALVKAGDYGRAMNIGDAEKKSDLKASRAIVALQLGRLDLAVTLFLSSDNPVEALLLRRDMHDWDAALQLASNLAPYMISDISRQYAVSEELCGEFSRALQLYEQAYRTAEEMHIAPDTAMIEKIVEGLARCNIRCGFVQRGIELAIKSELKKLQLECAEILEQDKHYEQAADIFEQCEEWDRSASVYIRMKQWDRVSRLLPHVKSPKIHAQYGKAKEAEGRLLEAAEAYERAADVDNAIRLYLAGDKPDNAIQMVRMSGSPSGSLMVARYFEKHGDFDTALRFLIISKCYEDSLLIAFKNGKAELYADIIQQEFGNENIPDEFKDGIRQVASYFDELKDSFKAGKYYSLSGDHAKAFKLLMKAAQSGVIINEDELMESLSMTVIASKNETFSRHLVDFLLGEQDGMPKDPKYLLRFYIKSHRLVEASKTALVVSHEEEKGGNYKAAHATLVHTCRQLRHFGMRIPKDIMDALRILHYYLLIRVEVAKSPLTRNPDRAARLLVHVTEHKSRFAKTAVNLLTLAVVECTRAGMKKTAMQCAYTLMKPEYRSQIPENFKPKIEKMIRKSGKADLSDVNPDCSPCPYCQKGVPKYDNVCQMCKNEIPFCIVSGQHITADDLTACPKCEFPAIRSEMFKGLETELKCPMCNDELFVKDIMLINDVRPYLYQSAGGPGAELSY